ncbi:hypothetical protein BDR26DRAFT_868923 [Obelidium mucronatum]|nr:hypothetical protein BDR26DRAFT_868923 [Obelidium mucronatum]
MPICHTAPTAFSHRLFSAGLESHTPKRLAAATHTPPMYYESTPQNPPVLRGPGGPEAAAAYADVRLDDQWSSPQRGDSYARNRASAREESTSHSEASFAASRPDDDDEDGDFLISENVASPVGANRSSSSSSKQRHGSASFKTKPRPKKYKCEFEGCSKSFARPCTLQVHYNEHNNIRPFECTSCPIKFTRKHDLLRHERTVHSRGKSMSCCRSCGMAFSRSDALRRHEKSCTI